MSKTDQLRKIKDEVLDLKNSPLYVYRTENKYFPVIGEGSHDAKIMFVGEAPGRNEAQTGRPFFGAAGKVLNQLLEHVGLKREDIYITNIVKDRPQQNRDPLPEEIKIYGPFLDRQIDIIQPKIIATLGRYSMDYIMRKFHLISELQPIGKAHGKVFDAMASYGPIQIAVLYHPAVAVYDPRKIDELKKDFEILKEE
jgi:uracil-DNA glycosylase family 4